VEFSFANSCSFHYRLFAMRFLGILPSNMPPFYHQSPEKYIPLDFLHFFVEFTSANWNLLLQFT